MEIRLALSNDLEPIRKINENVYAGLDYLHAVLPENGFPVRSPFPQAHLITCIDYTV